MVQKVHENLHRSGHFLIESIVKNEKFTCSEPQEIAINTIKNVSCQTSMLQGPDPNADAILDAFTNAEAIMDASDTGSRAVITQIIDKKQRVKS